MNRIVINGKEIKCNGNNISIIDNKVFVDGKIISEKKVSDKCDKRNKKHIKKRLKEI